MNPLKLQASIKSWQTTALGFIAGLMILLAQTQAFLDSDPATVLSWQQVVAGLTLMGFGIVAKDGNKKSEDVGL